MVGGEACEEVLVEVVEGSAEGLPVAVGGEHIALDIASDGSREGGERVFGGGVDALGEFEALAEDEAQGVALLAELVVEACDTLLGELFLDALFLQQGVGLLATEAVEEGLLLALAAEDALAVEVEKYDEQGDEGGGDAEADGGPEALAREGEA